MLGAAEQEGFDVVAGPAGDVETEGGAVEESLDLLHGREVEPAASQPVGMKVYADAFDGLGSARGVCIVLPVVREIRANEDHVAGLEAGEGITDEAVPAGLLHHGDFEFRVAVPDAAEGVAADDVAVDAVFRAGGEFFKGRLHPRGSGSDSTIMEVSPLARPAGRENAGNRNAAPWVREAKGCGGWEAQACWLA